MNNLEKYGETLEKYFGSGVVKFDTSSGVTNNIIGALNHEQFESFRSVFHKRCERLAGLYDESDSNRPFLLERLNEMASASKWSGVYAEMVAFDFLNSDEDHLLKPIDLSKTVPASETLAGKLGAQNTNFDGYYDDYNVCFDVKVLSDKSKDILDGIIAEVIKRLGITEITISPEYPLDSDFELFEKNRNALRLELQSSIDLGKQTSFVKSTVVPNLNYRLLWGKGALSTVSTYDPYQHAEKHHTLLFKHAKKFSKTQPSLIVFVLFPWFSEKVVNEFCSRDVFYKEFCRRFFCQYVNDSNPASSILKSFKGNETLAQVTDKLSGVIFLEDTSIESSNPDGLNVTGFAYLNPNAINKVDDRFQSHLSRLGITVDDLKNDNH
tara:strand:+ start:3921 stop:5063 length:1143 start_codon:yes stop_codon:yes gene_type:complete